MLQRSIALITTCLLAAGCGVTSVPPPRLDGGGGDLAGGGCISDRDCAGATPRCDRNASKCVACLPMNDNCPKGQRCIASNGSFACSTACVADGDCPRSDAGAPTTCCNGACVDTSSDAQSCGRCGNNCLAPANATPACIGGMCGVGACNLGFLDCDRAANNGCEVNAAQDDKNCGVCGKVCSAGANQKSSCVGGSCVAACNTGFADCDMNAANGCEVDTTGDVRNCGGCGAACAPANAAPACRSGACAIGSCNAGFGDCNQQAQDGCESDLAQDVQHCGNCMTACAAPNGLATCRVGACAVASCNMGFADCDSLPINGCEIDIAGDARNCGGCGRSCMGANSMQACQVGICTINACTPGYSDCDRKPETGCEVNIASDLANCGGCGNACPVPANATASCMNAQCGIGACKFGFADCNKSANDGCEVDLTTVANCGQCGNACSAPPNAAPACKAGMCALGMCNNLFGDCDGNPANGCEKALANDPGNCGKCGTVCNFANAQGACLNGQCGILQCNAGYGDCDGNPANGCEASVTKDAKNCGKCGTVCPMNLPFCSNGACVALPANPFFNSMPVVGTGTTRQPGAACGTLIAVNQPASVLAIGAYLGLGIQSNIKFGIWTHPGHQLVYITTPKSFPLGTNWLTSDPFPAVMLQAGLSYDIAAVGDQSVTYYYDTQAENMNGIVSQVSNPNLSNYANPVIDGGHAGADCGIELF